MIRAAWYDMVRGRTHYWFWGVWVNTPPLALAFYTKASISMREIDEGLDEVFLAHLST